MDCTLRFGDVVEVPCGLEWSVTAPSSEEFLNPWKMRIILYVHMGLYKTVNLSLFQCFPIQGIASPSKGSQATIKSCSFYCLNICQFHSLLSVPPPPPRKSLYLLSTRCYSGLLACPLVLTLCMFHALLIVEAE